MLKAGKTIDHCVGTHTVYIAVNIDPDGKTSAFEMVGGKDGDITDEAAADFKTLQHEIKLPDDLSFMLDKKETVIEFKNQLNFGNLDLKEFVGKSRLKGGLRSWPLHEGCADPKDGS